MKSLSLSLGLAALALALALVCTPASAEEGRLLSLMPLMPSREEQRALLREARGHGNFAERMRPPVAGLRRKLQMEGALPAAAAAATHVAASGHEKIVPKHKGEKHAGEREPQPDFAGRVQVALPRDHTGRIINGQKAVLGQFPWQAGVYMDFGFSGKAWCGGSIIHSEWILTAAHCVDDEPDSYMIVVGSLGSEAGKEPTRQEFKGITETYQHPGYDPYFIDNDIGFVKLSSTNKIKYSAYVMPIRLPSYSMAVDMMVGTVGTVSGWGLIADSASWITDQLMYVSNKIDDGKACYDYYGNAWIPNKICTKTEDIKSICSGDSGGAFTFEEEPGVHTQIGIVSFGARKGCEFGLPTAYTRLASHLDFVEEITNIAIRD